MIRGAMCLPWTFVAWLVPAVLGDPYANPCVQRQLAAISPDELVAELAELRQAVAS